MNTSSSMHTKPAVLPSTGKILTIEQCKSLIAQMSLRDKSLFVALIICGSESRTWKWMDAIEHSLDMPIALWFILRDYANSRGLFISPLTGSDIKKIQVHWVGGPVYEDAIWSAKSGIVARLVRGEVEKTRIGFAQPLTTQEITRRFKRYARLVSFNANEINLRTVINTHHYFTALYADRDELTEVLGLESMPGVNGNAARITPAGTEKGVSFVPVTFQALSSSKERLVERDPRLHGIGRRSKSRVAIH